MQQEQDTSRGPTLRERLNDAEAQLSQCAAVDREVLTRRLRGLQRAMRENRTIGKPFAAFVKDLQASVARQASRRARLPQPTFPQNLPVVERRKEIAAAIANHQVVVICGETGSGKTTQIPKICLDIGRGVNGVIGHTQARRLAARTLADRIASELHVTTGKAVGYKVRFGDKTSPETCIKVMTDGILLAETQGDPLLQQYDTIIIDEAHERSLNIDFLLGYLRKLLPKRPDLKVIVTSATIDPLRFSEHFGGPMKCPVIEVSGRTYPVETRYRPMSQDDDDEQERREVDGIVDAVDELCAAGRGDILVFLAGERQIREAADALASHKIAGGLEILPLFARLSNKDQQKVFEPHGKRRVVLSTNVAETSLTVPGIHYVIDTGRARISRYNPRTKVQRLPIESISQASANQRKGRCGRLADGICIRLYSEEDFNKRDVFTLPEIQRTNLAAVILQMKALRLGEIEQFPFMDPPHSRMIRDGYDTLLELGAVDEQRRITRIGLELARLPIDPRIGRMILAAREENSLAEVLIIAAALSVQDPRERPAGQEDAAESAQQKFRDDTSDFTTYLNLWKEYQDSAKRLNGNQLKRWCQQHFLSYMRMREWIDVHRQLAEQAQELGLQINSDPADYNQIHRALLTGLLSQIGVKGEEVEYIGARGRTFYVFPGSGLFRNKPAWIMAAELVETTRLYARTCAQIQPRWIEKIAGDLVQRTYDEARWDKRLADVMANEKVTLFGLPIVQKRQIHYGPINPVEAREIFVDVGLVQEQYDTTAPFRRHNQLMIEHVRTLEAKSRQADLLVEHQAIFAFYDKHVPVDVYNGKRFEQWRREAERQNRKLLMLTEDDVLQYSAAAVTKEQYPDHSSIAGQEVELSYHLEPGHRDDGVTMTVPLAAVPQLDAEQLEWLVPGLFKDKAAALVKSLPKTLRRNFVPVPDTVNAVSEIIRFGEGDMLDALSGALEHLRGVKVPRDAWQLGELPSHLRMNVCVVDDAGKPLAVDRDVLAIRKQLGRIAEEAFEHVTSATYNRDDITSWDFGDLPPHVQVSHEGLTLRGYPALIDQGEAASLRLFPSTEQASSAMRGGVRRLFALAMRSELRTRIENISDIDRLRLQYSSIGPAAQLSQDIGDAMCDRVFLAGRPEVRTQMEFMLRERGDWQRLDAALAEILPILCTVLATYHDVALQLDREIPVPWEPAFAEMTLQLAHLLPRGFVTSTPQSRWKHLPRYLQAMDLRLRKLMNGNVARDTKLAEGIKDYWQRYVDMAARRRADGIHDPMLEGYRWMLEEYRVSLFAQELGTAEHVSPERLDRQWSAVRQ